MRHMIYDTYNIHIYLSIGVLMRNAVALRL